MSNNTSVFVLVDKIPIDDPNKGKAKLNRVGVTTPFKEYRVRDYLSFEIVIK